MFGQLRRGSTVDAPLGVFAALKELARTPRGAPDSPLSMKDVGASTEYRDLSTPKVRPGDLAPEFALASLDLGDGTARQTGDTVRLSAFRAVSPVALIFGSYT